MRAALSLSLGTCWERARHSVGKGCVPMLYLEPKLTFLYVAKSLIYLAPRAGFEPATNRLTAGCSTAELPGNSLLGAMKARI